MSVSHLTLNDGNPIPQIGLGTWPLDDHEARNAVAHALRHGYRHIDTAAAYGNETGVGLGIRDSDVPREDLFITTKIGNGDHGYHQARQALDASLSRLRLDYVDLILIHWPMPSLDRYLATWEALIAARQAGKTRSIGVSNFRPAHLDRLIHSTGVTPAVNQIEVNPRVQHTALRQAAFDRGITVTSWSPLGAGLLDNTAVQKIATKHGKSGAQIILRWHLELGLIPIPKSATPHRIESNIDILDFALDTHDMATLAALDQRLPASYPERLAGTE